jgi:hypothetical protein
MRGEDDGLVRHSISKISKMPNDRGPCIAMARSGKISNTLEEYHGRFSCLKNLTNIEEQRASRAIPKSKLATGFTERLAGESGGKYIVRWNLRSDEGLREVADIPFRANVPVSFVDT